MAKVLRPGRQAEELPVPTLSAAERIISAADPHYMHLVEVVPIGRRRVLLVDEEGLLFKQPYNPAASEVAGCDIVGTAILMTRQEYAAGPGKST